MGGDEGACGHCGSQAVGISCSTSIGTCSTSAAAACQVKKRRHIDFHARVSAVSLARAQRPPSQAGSGVTFDDVWSTLRTDNGLEYRSACRGRTQYSVPCFVCMRSQHALHTFCEK